ncbi:MFS transporter [Phytohabitans kaempferiae]|uniref:MFS transporter n=1 Tax=Phytohabitans kaempferiae TaxID=1620943 RepID=A0ABV6LV00_9ACTN
MIPARYWLWLAGVTLSLLGTQVLGFGMTWTAAGQGGVLAGLVLTMINLPRALLVLIGGAVGDRFGAWRTMLAGDAAMIAATVLLAVLVWLVGEPVWLLLGIALVIGTVDAFYLPSSGSMPRRLVPGEGLARAMSARQLAGQTTAIAGPPLGGLVVAGLGLAAAALADAFTFAVMLLILVLLRPRGEAAPPKPGPGGVWRHTLDGLRLAAHDRLLRAALLMVVVAAGFLLPVIGLLLPLLGRERAWSGGWTGAVAGTVALATACVAATVLARGAAPRPGVAAALGLVVAAAGVLGLAVFEPPAYAAAAALAAGAGNGLFATHLAPLLLQHTPETHLARVQSVVLLAQSLPLLVTNNLLGAAVDAVGTPPVLATCAAITAVTGAAGLASPTLRRTRAR